MEQQTEPHVISEETITQGEDGYYNLKNVEIYTKETDINRFTGAYGGKIEKMTVFPAYEIDDKTEGNIKKIISNIVRKENISSNIESLVYSCLKELVINAHKANLKATLFQKEHLDPKKEEDYNRGTAMLKNCLNEHSPEFRQLKNECKASDKYISVKFFPDQDTLLLIVKNNTPLSDRDDKRIRYKLHKASKYDDLGHYYSENMDELEGQGIGLAMILLMLKAQKIPSKNFVIYKSRSNPNETIARIIFELKNLD